MLNSESILNIAPALVSAQKSMGAAKKAAENPYFHSSYADLGEVIRVCKDALNEAGITVLQPVCGDLVKTILIHVSGEWISSEGTRIICTKQNDPQAQGSAITYARRYDLQSMLTIPSEDDDGNGAVDRANMTDINSAIKIMTELKDWATEKKDQKRVAAVEAMIKDLEEAKKGKRTIAKADIEKWKERAKEILNTKPEVKLEETK